MCDVISQRHRCRPHQGENARHNLEEGNGQLLGKTNCWGFRTGPSAGILEFMLQTNYWMLDKANKMAICSRSVQLELGCCVQVVGWVFLFLGCFSGDRGGSDESSSRLEQCSLHEWLPVLQMPDAVNLWCSRLLSWTKIAMRSSRVSWSVHTDSLIVLSFEAGRVALYEICQLYA